MSIFLEQFTHNFILKSSSTYAPACQVLPMPVCGKYLLCAFAVLVFTAWNAVGIPCADVPCLVQVVSAMATGGARDACVSEQDIPSKCETLVPIV